MKVTQSHPTLCDPVDYTVDGTLQARILEWVAFPFSGGSSQPRDRTQVSHIAGVFFTTEPQGKPAMQETQVQFLGQEDPLEKEMATHSSILAWRIQWTEEPDRGSQQSDTT